MGGRGQALAAHRGRCGSVMEFFHNGVHFARRVSTRARARNTSEPGEAWDSGLVRLGPCQGPWPRTLDTLRPDLRRCMRDLLAKNRKKFYNRGFDVTITESCLYLVLILTANLVN